MKILKGTLLLGLFAILSCGPQGQQAEMTQEAVTKETPPPDYDPEARLSELGIELPTPSSPVANYVNAVRTGNLVFLAGKGPKKPDGEYVTGKLGTELTVEEGYNAARLVGISQLAVLQDELGNLNKVKRIVKVLGMVNASPDFMNHPEVVNGFSDLMVEVFGERGKHARAAVGMGSLPRGISVEIEMVVEVYED
jgi:enamine deaminase RidA (YjgF/YER057c/UK114 family)